MKKVKMRLDFGSVDSITNTLYKDVLVIVVNGGGGMGGSREVIRCRIISPKTDKGFMVVQDIITDEIVDINPRFIGTIRTVNVTKVYFEHHNSNFPSGKRTYWFTHKVNTEIELCKDEWFLNNGERIRYPSIDQGKNDDQLKLELIRTDDMNYL